MTRLLKMRDDEYSGFVRVLFGLSSQSPLEDLEMGKLEWIDPSLNESQKDAVCFALASREVALIHGPPGVRPSLSTVAALSDKKNRLAKRIH